jgi:hypothetical protein
MDLMLVPVSPSKFLRWNPNLNVKILEGGTLRRKLETSVGWVESFLATFPWCEDTMKDSSLHLRRVSFESLAMPASQPSSQIFNLQNCEKCLLFVSYPAYSTLF